MRGLDGAEQRQPLVEDHVEAAPQDDADARQRRARVGRADGERAGAPAGPATEPNAGPAPPSFPAGATTSVFEVERALDRARLGAVGERRVRLGDADQRDAHRIV